MNKFVIFGAGNDLKIFARKYPIKHFEVLGIVDNNKVGEHFEGFTICDKSILKKIQSDVIIAISSSKFFEEIRDEVYDINPEFVCIPLGNIFSYLGKIGYCNICAKDVKMWGYCGYQIITKYSIIGNGKRAGLCPHCQSYDRTRWFYFILKNFTSIFEEGGEILHFAPEIQIERQLRKIGKCNYYTADIVKDAADYIVDMTSMPFEDNKFDFIIANHVLEHIKDEKSAVSELKRCIKRNGKIILSFPVAININTFEIDDLRYEEEKTYYYGQSDHVRLYGKDFKEHLENYGLKVDVYSPEELLLDKTIEKLKLIRNDKLLICSI